jgi:hypothetical protein
MRSRAASNQRPGGPQPLFTKDVIAHEAALFTPALAQQPGVRPLVFRVSNARLGAMSEAHDRSFRRQLRPDDGSVENTSGSAKANDMGPSIVPSATQVTRRKLRLRVAGPSLRAAHEDSSTRPTATRRTRRIGNSPPRRGHPTSRGSAIIGQAGQAENADQPGGGDGTWRVPNGSCAASRRRIARRAPLSDNLGKQPKVCG